jgi:hypothetical protein
MVENQGVQSPGGFRKELVDLELPLFAPGLGEPDRVSDIDVGQVEETHVDVEPSVDDVRVFVGVARATADCFGGDGQKRGIRLTGKRRDFARRELDSPIQTTLLPVMREPAVRGLWVRVRHPAVVGELEAKGVSLIPGNIPEF